MLRFFRCCLSPPWGVLIPLSGLFVFAFLIFAGRSPEQLAKQLGTELAVASEEDADRIAEKMGALGRAGVPELVRGLHSTRRCTFLAAQNVLEKRFHEWSQQGPQYSAPMNLALARALAEKIDSLPATGKMLAASWSQRILNTMLDLEKEQYPLRTEITAECEKILRRTEGERFVSTQPKLLDELHILAAGGEPTRVYSPDSLEKEMMIASRTRTPRNGIPDPTSTNEKGYDGYFDTYSDSRAELLYAVHQSRLHPRTATPHLPEKSIESVPGVFPNAEGMMLAGEPRSPLGSGTVPGLESAESGPKIASQYSADGNVKDSSSENPPIEERLSALPLFDPQENKNEHPFVDRDIPVENTELGQTGPDEIEDLPTADLIRLLQHPNKSICALAEKTLRNRDHFQDGAIFLAYRLHHPNVEIRKEVLDLLSKTPTIQPVPWLMVLLRDPNRDIRLSAITYIATSSDRDMIQAITERAKQDPDPVINGMIEKLEKAGFLNLK